MSFPTAPNDYVQRIYKQCPLRSWIAPIRSNFGEKGSFNYYQSADNSVVWIYQYRNDLCFYLDHKEVCDMNYPKAMARLQSRCLENNVLQLKSQSNNYGERADFELLMLRTSECFNILTARTFYMQQ